MGREAKRNDVRVSTKGQETTLEIEYLTPGDLKIGFATDGVDEWTSRLSQIPEIEHLA